MNRLLVLLLLLVGMSCKNKHKETPLYPEINLTPYQEAVAHPMIDFKGMTVTSRFEVPVGFVRTEADDNSFASYLRTLPLKTPGAQVLYFDGRTKPQEVHEAVVDLKIGTKDLHQCADALMRLKAEYHWLQKEYGKIHFNFTNGFRAAYSEWRQGKRIHVEGNMVKWKSDAEASDSYASFWDYLEQVFMYAGTLSLSEELVAIEIEELKIGDIFIQGGSPGHAVIVVDMAHNERSESIFILAQSYMPAQEIHILKNINKANSPWYSVPSTGKLITPEWTFSVKDLKRFKEN